ncbi:hypothetical protein [Couchioplanes caeruleus]|uniref:hypothetical protein n=1 Tax=Couchioplanes caeruleus TaxID=56438 RepID=UPI001FD5FC48|nr:hypothetical protein [Couchioplanes caeruleus]
MGISVSEHRHRGSEGLQLFDDSAETEPYEAYVFTDETYDNLLTARMSPLSVMEVLHAHGVVRRHIGSAMQVAGQDRKGDWLVVALIEDSDDVYTVASARYLDDEEIEAIARIKGD